jgi:methylase of polypeptide subunit release factors
LAAILGSRALEREEYERLRLVEDRMWWFAALHANLGMLYRRFAPAARRQGRVLDAGCGTGGLLRRLTDEIPDEMPWATTIGVDADETACRWAAEKSERPIC